MTQSEAYKRYQEADEVTERILAHHREYESRYKHSWRRSKLLWIIGALLLGWVVGGLVGRL